MGARRQPFEVPEQVKIRGKVWRVRRKSALAGETATHPGYAGDLDGVTCVEDRTIDVAAKLAGTREEAVTVLHELMHACSDRRVDAEVEERLIAGMDRALLGALEQLRWRT